MGELFWRLAPPPRLLDVFGVKRAVVSSQCLIVNPYARVAAPPGRAKALARFVF